MPVDPIDPQHRGKADEAGLDPSGATPERLRGTLCRDRVDTGSKSDRVAVLLALSDGERLVLRRAGAHPFRDPELEALEGQVLIVEGERRASYFLVRRYAVCGDDESIDP
ncbi:hypothetical protein CDN99_19455 [Roseateles aquatilis]|uniref:Uncharacterized protein n=1 Tax=Roseateles aquatilis TaxID=431061 RepID=A0A246J2S2_9BURK|nr:hypothetical protein [Roseateles aquatilis]OWQ86888.1 hypothetical protein CDN99_19455 [Roseateles aquatilis]